MAALVLDAAKEKNIPVMQYAQCVPHLDLAECDLEQCLLLLLCLGL